MNPKLLRAVAGAGVLFLAMQMFSRPDFDNPPVTAEIKAPPDVLGVLERACYNCHSHETRWPWYGRVAPVSWLVADDVQDARAVLNFSTWESEDRLTRIYNKGEILRRVTRHEMPPSRYTWMHPSARLDDADLEVLRRWAGRK